MDQKYHITRILARPYGPTSKLAEEYPEFEEFDVRKDFILFRNMSHIAVMVRITNAEYGIQGQGVTKNFTVQLYDGDKDEVIAHADFKVRLSPWKSHEDVRVDLEASYYDIKPFTPYRIQVRQSNSKKIIEESTIRFFELDVLPTHTVAINGAYLEKDGVMYRNMTFDYYGENTLNFSVENLEYSDEVPELGLVLHTKNGIREMITSQNLHEYCTYVFDDHEETLPTRDSKFTARFQIDHDFDLEGPLYGELSIFGKTITGIVFTGESDEEGTYEAEELETVEYPIPERIKEIIEKRAENKNKAQEDAHKKLDSLIGLENVKSKIKMYESLVKFRQLRQKAGFADKMPSLHSMFLGAPGTGKTTVAKIIGQLLHETGVLSKGHVVVCERSTLLGKYYNSESEKTLEVLEEAKGGVLFIDEAYQLYQPEDPKDPGKFVLETLMTALADEGNRDWMLVLAGYTEPMKRMFDLNPGLSSRIPEANIYHFEDYLPEQLYNIADTYIDTHGYRLTPNADAALKALLKNDYDHRTKDFGNARHVVNLIENSILPQMAMRLYDKASPTADDLSTIIESDIPTPKIRIGEPLHARVGFRC